ncbi:MAG: hypothetical protein KGJ92_05830 [Actinomycetales bacterium]|nr:hypothetical protein [Actinomycetales bacterium]
MSGRVVAAAVVAYIGATPIPETALRDAIVVVAVVGALVWPRFVGRPMTSCPVATPESSTSPKSQAARPSDLTALDREKEHHVH